MFASLLAFFVIGFIALIVLSVAFAVIGGVLSLAGIVLFKVVPILLLGWLAVKLFQRAGGGSRGLSSSDRRWLDE